VNLWGAATARGSKLNAGIVVCVILFLHFMLVLACEFASSQGVKLAVFVASAMVLEMLAGAALFLRAMRMPRLRETRSGVAVLAAD
jgi:hypothetical protein